MMLYSDDLAIGITVAVFIGIYTLNRRIALLEKKVQRLSRQSGIADAAIFSLSDSVKILADDPMRKIQAIKVYREETGVSLVEAKEAVESYINSRQ